MSDQEDVSLLHLSREEIQDLIDDMDLDVTVDDLLKAAQLAKESADLEQLRAAMEEISKAA